MATWASAICDPNQDAVREAANDLGLAYRTVDIDEFPDLAKAYGVLNVPAVTLEGDTTMPPIIGARRAPVLIALLLDRLAG